MDEDALRAMMPVGFGKASKPRAGPLRKPFDAASGSSTVKDSFAVQHEQSRSQTLVGEDEEEDDGLTAEEREANRLATEAGDVANSDEDEDLGPEPQGPDIESSLPTDDKVVLKDHTKAVSALAIDASGARVATGSYDYDVKLWDFGGMSQSFKPFKSFEPAESSLVHDLAWSPSGEKLLVACGTAQARLYDREGRFGATTKKGDVYIRDMRHTAGHVAEITSCFWHPFARNTFATTSADSTVRLWSVEDQTRQETVVVVKSKERGTRTKVTTGAFSHDGKMMAAACLDGAMHIYSTSGTYSRPNATVEGAHVRDSETSSVCFSKDGRTLASRGGDGTVKLWDVRSFKKALVERGGLHNAYGQTNVIFSPDESALLTGTSVERKETSDGTMGRVIKDGGIEILSRGALEPIKHISLSGEEAPSSVIRLAWHSRINQLFASTSSGAVHLYFSPVKSSRGALLCVGKRARVRAYDEDHDGSSHVGPIITPGSSDAQQRGQGVGAAAKKRKMEKMRQDATASRMPERPLEGQGRGGRIGAAATQHMVQGILQDTSRTEDPREALLKYADKAASDPQWTRAWKKTQPTPVFRKDDEGQAER